MFLSNKTNCIFPSIFLQTLVDIPLLTKVLSQVTRALGYRQCTEGGGGGGVNTLGVVQCICRYIISASGLYSALGDVMI